MNSPVMRHLLAPIFCFLSSLLWFFTSPVHTQAQGLDVLYTFRPSTEPYSPNGRLLQTADGNFYGVAFGSGVLGNGAIYRMAPGGQTTIAHSFDGADGLWPVAGLTPGKNGQMFGTTGEGGAKGAGTLFLLQTDGTFTLLHNFDPNTEGSWSQSALVLARDGLLYGALTYGGVHGMGSLFRVNSDNSITVLYAFSGADGANPHGDLIQGQDGSLYGATMLGGAHNQGTIFKLSTSGGSIKVLHSFAGGDDGSQPWGGLTQLPGGALYGTARNAGPHNVGTIFQINPDGTGFQTRYAFSGSDGDGPEQSLTPASDGNLYGSTLGGGTHYHGALFCFNPTGAGNLTLLYSFVAEDGAYPRAPLTQGRDGLLYGSASRGGTGYRGALFSLTTAGKFTSLHSFAAAIDAGNPQAGIVQGKDGNLYGVTLLGGPSDMGRIFRLSLTGVETDLHDFPFWDGTHYARDGGQSSGLIQAADSAFYGTTFYGGSIGGGTVYRITSSGSFQTIYNFAFGTDGANPTAPVTQGPDGALYGTTSSAGAHGLGTIYRVTKTGPLSTLHAFAGGTEGTNPTGTLTFGPDGKLYGITQAGGKNSQGTVFSLSMNGTAFSTLHTFDGVTGAQPAGGVVFGRDGNLYGLTTSGGTVNSGVFYQMNRSGTTFQLIHTFVNGQDGAAPDARLLLASEGTLYGVTPVGGLYGQGIAFSWSAAKGWHLLHAFGWQDGTQPHELIEGFDGDLYSAVLNNGPYLAGDGASAGTVFRIATRLPLITVIGPASGPAGTTVVLLGANLIGVSQVQFNGTKAKFTVRTASKLTAVVPLGAKSGPIAVFTPSGWIYSPTNFTVK